DKTPIQNRAVSKTLEAAQKKVEGFHFDTRKNVVQYDNVMNRHRKAVYASRKKILEGQDISDEINKLVAEEVGELTKYSLIDDPKFVENFKAFIPLEESILKKIGKAKE